MTKAAGAGFSIADFNRKKYLPLHGGSISDGPQGNLVWRAACENDVTWQATFEPVNGNLVKVKGKMTSRRAADRALLSRYTLPQPTTGAHFEDKLARSVKIGEQSPERDAIFPVAAATKDSWELAMADCRKRIEHGRTVMGPKLVTALVYDWDTKEKVVVQLNRALPHAVFVAPNLADRDGHN